MRLRLVRMLLIALGAACTAVESSTPAMTPVRPRHQFTTNEAFGANTIPSYSGAHNAAYAYIQANISAHTENLRRWVRQQSVSAQNIGIQQMAEMLRRDLLSLGFKEAELVPTSGHPGVWGFFSSRSPMDHSWPGQRPASSASVWGIASDE